MKRERGGPLKARRRFISDLKSEKLISGMVIPPRVIRELEQIGDSMSDLTKRIASALRELADQVEDRGLRSASWSTQQETIKTKSHGTFQERRIGPHMQFTILLEFSNIDPVNIKDGEESDKFWKGDYSAEDKNQTIPTSSSDPESSEE